MGKRKNQKGLKEGTIDYVFCHLCFVAYSRNKMFPMHNNFTIRYHTGIGKDLVTLLS